MRRLYKLTKVLKLIAFAVIPAITACNPGKNGEIAPIDTVLFSKQPLGNGTNTPNLTSGKDGSVYLSYSEEIEEGAFAVRFISLNGEEWSEPSDVVRGRPLFVNWADFPGMTVLENGNLAAFWLESDQAESHFYSIRLTQSSDGGRSWSEPITPHKDGLLAEHGFVSIWPAENNSIGMAWLDGRKTAMKDSAREMTLRSAIIEANSVTYDDILLDPRVCDCCQTSSASTRNGRVLVYRDRSEGEIRDISIVRMENGQWSSPMTVHNDGWHFIGCPVNGPSVAANGDTVAVAWFTGANDTAKVNISFSLDSGKSFGNTIRVDNGSPTGRASVVFDTKGNAIVLWLENPSAKEESELQIRRVSHTGKSSPHNTVSEVANGRRTGFPRMTVSGSKLYMAWTEAQESLRVVVASANLE